MNKLIKILKPFKILRSTYSYYSQSYCFPVNKIYLNMKTSNKFNLSLWYANRKILTDIRNNNWKFVWTFLNLYFKYKVNIYFILQTASKQGIHYLLGQVFLVGGNHFYFFIKNAFRIFRFFVFFLIGILFGVVYYVAVSSLSFSQ